MGQQLLQLLPVPLGAVVLDQDRLDLLDVALDLAMLPLPVLVVAGGDPQLRPAGGRLVPGDLHGPPLQVRLGQVLSVAADPADDLLPAELVVAQRHRADPVRGGGQGVERGCLGLAPHPRVADHDLAAVRLARLGLRRLGEHRQLTDGSAVLPGKVWWARIRAG